MKSLRRFGPTSKSAAPAAKSATADLFADQPPPMIDCVPATAPAPLAASAPAAAPAVSEFAAPPPPRRQPLWYAVVFAELSAARAEFMLPRLCLAAQRFTSWVSIEMPDALLLEIRGSVKLFGSLAALHAELDAAWRQLKLPARTATAPTTLGALWLARAGKHLVIEESGALAGALAELPVACTAWPADRLQTLKAMGVTRMAELLRLPRAGLARRLGPAAVMEVDIALAKRTAPRRAFVPRERFQGRCDFETEIETAVYLQKAVEPLVGHCAQFLRRRQAGVQALELRLRHRVIPETRVRVGLANVTGEHRRLADVLKEKLQRLELPAPVRGMELRSGPLQPLSCASLDAFAGLRSGGRDTAPQLVERLRARLGEQAVYGVVTIAEHRPEAAWQRVHELWSRAGGCAARSGQEMRRPVWLLAEPAILCTSDVLCTSELRRLHEGGLILEEGPERIESGWWDGRGIARDYYVARQGHGARWWIFQERQTKCWYLHGVFA